MIKINKNCKSSERGAALIIALVFMVALFLVVTSAMRFQRSTAENISQVSISSQERWAARGLTARAAGWLISKLPVEYKNDLQAALRNCENKNLPAFNPPENSSAAPCEVSNLGNIQDWLNSKKGGAVLFALESNQSARVAVNLTEAYRTSSDGTWQYKINYLVDSGNGETYGADTNQGEIFLGELETCTCELKLSSTSYAVPVGDSITLTSEFWNIEKMELYENNVLVDSSPVQNLKTRQVKNWTRTINAETTFFVKGYVATNNCNAISNITVVAVTVVIPTPTPTPTPTETPTPTPPPFASRLCLAQNGGSGQGWIGTACAEKNGSVLNIQANIGGPTNYFSPSCFVSVKDQFGATIASVSCNANGGSAANYPNIAIPVSSEVDHLEFSFSARNQGNSPIGGASETLGVGGCRVTSGNGTCSRY